MDVAKDKLLRFVPYQSTSRQPNPTQLGQQGWIARPCVRACDKCRRRKKRCPHYGSEDLDNDTDDADGGRGNRKEDHNSSEQVDMAQESSSSQVTSQRQGFLTRTLCEDHSQDETRQTTAELDGESRFVGDLNPEAAFLAATSPVRSSRSNGDAEEVGVWTARKRRKLSHNISCPGPTSRRETSSHQPFQQNNISNPLRRFLWSHSLLIPNFEEAYKRLLPPSLGIERLYKIYLDDIHPIFPAIDINAFEQKVNLGAHDHVFLQQAICLAASKSPSAKPFLRLSSISNRILTQAEIGSELIGAIRIALDFGLVRNKLVLTQGLALASFLTQFSENRDISLQLTADAVTHCHTSGIHLDKADDDHSDRAFNNQLFCCVWAVDRLNAAFHGRPLLMHERDFGTDLLACITEQKSCFQVFLRSIKLLDEVITIYRPNIERGSHINGDSFPLFESLIEESQALNVKSRLLATVELLFHSVAMLSCRTGVSKKQQQQQQQQQQRGSDSHNKHQATDHSISKNAYLRQHLSAYRATAIVSSELNSNQLPYIPILPYAISLSLRVAYRDLRTAKAQMLRIRAREQLLLNASILRSLGEVFDSAAGLAQLAEEIVHEMDKVFSSRLGQRGGEKFEDNTCNISSGSSKRQNQPSHDESASRHHRGAERQQPERLGLSNSTANNNKNNNNNIRTLQTYRSCQIPEETPEQDNGQIHSQQPPFPPQRPQPTATSVAASDNQETTPTLLMRRAITAATTATSAIGVTSQQKPASALHIECLPPTPHEQNQGIPNVPIPPTARVPSPQPPLGSFGSSDHDYDHPHLSNSPLNLDLDLGLDLDLIGGDFDVFAHFDPNFNLDAVDVTLGGEDMIWMS